jgi:hypothetical protein
MIPVELRDQKNARGKARGRVLHFDLLVGSLCWWSAYLQAYTVMRTLEGDEDTPYTHQLSLSSPVINKLFTPAGSKPLLPAQGEGSRRGIFGRTCILFSIHLSHELQAHVPAVESVAQVESA